MHKLRKEMMNFDARQDKETSIVMLGGFLYIIFAFIITFLFDGTFPNANYNKILEISLVLAPVLLLGWIGIFIFLFWSIPLTLILIF